MSVKDRWVLLSYRMPREPSTPRIAVWRKLKRLGVAQVSDGLVALPADARTREQLEWVADEVVEAGGSAGIWLAQPASVRQERELAERLANARAAEYQAIIDEVTEIADRDATARRSALRRLRAELGRVSRRDFFPPPERQRAKAALDELAGEPAGERT